MINKSGLISKSEIWQGNIWIESDILIPKGVTVRVKPGCRIKFASKIKKNYGFKERPTDFRTCDHHLGWLDEGLNLEKCLIFVEGAFCIRGTNKNMVVIGNKEWEGAIVFLSGIKSKITNCLIKNAFYAVLSYGDSKVNISNTIFEDNSFGYANMSQNNVKNNVFRNNMLGIACLWAKKIVVSGNTIENNILRGMVCYEVKDSVIRDNVILSNKAGVDMHKCEKLQISDNKFNKNMIGILNNHNSEIGISGNEIKNSSLLGISNINYSEALIISDNLLAGNKTACNFEGRGLGIAINRNTIKKGYEGIEFNCEINAELKGNYIKTSNFDITANENSNVTFNNNIFEGSVNIQARGTSIVNIINSDLKFQKIGVICQDFSSVLIEGSRLEGVNNKGTGIEICGEAHIDIKGNTISNLELGVKCLEQGNVFIDNNSISCAGNLKAIQIEHAAKAEIIGNRLSGIGKNNKATGIDISGAAKANLEKNVTENLWLAASYTEHSSGRITGNDFSGTGSSTAIKVKNMAEVTINNNGMKNIAYGVSFGDEAKIAVNDNNINAAKFIYNNANLDYYIVEGLLQKNGFVDVDTHAEGRVIPKLLRKFVLKTRQNIILNYFYKRIYKLTISIFKLIVENINGVKAIYLRRGLTFSDWIPGLSDIDLLLCIADLSIKDEICLVRKLKKRYSFLKNIFPFLGEIHISTKKELEAFKASGSVRSLEAINNWKNLYGTEKTCGTAFIDKDSVILSSLNEMMNSYKALTELYFSKNRELKDTLAYIKAFIDVIRYFICADNPGIIFHSRKEILDIFIEKYGGSGEIDMLQDIEDIWVKNKAINDNLYAKSFQFMLVFIDKSLKIIFDKILGIDKYQAHYKALKKINNDTDCDINQIETWEKHCSDLVNYYSGQISGVIMDNPGFLYFLLKDGVEINTVFISKLSDIKENMRSIGFARNTPAIFLTKNMFQAILYSLHLESPFNYYKLLKGNCVDVYCCGGEERWQYNINKEDFAAPSNDVVYMLIKDAVNALNLSMRVQSSVNINRKNNILYIFNRILGLCLAVDKKVIAEPFMGNILSHYKEYFPEDSKVLERFEEQYLNKSNFDLNKLSCNEVFDDIYPFLKSKMDRINILLGNNSHA